MKSSHVLVKLSLSIACLLLYHVVVFAQDPELMRHFDYDAKAPLDLKIISSQKRGGATVYDITYASPKGGVVPAYLVVPATGKGPFAAVVWGHWYWTNSEMRNRKQFLDEAVALAPAGVVSLLTDGPIARPGYVVDQQPLSEKQAAYKVQQVIDMRRGVDLLLARKDVDPKRLAFVGHRSQLQCFRWGDAERRGPQIQSIRFDGGIHLGRGAPENWRLRAIPPASGTGDVRRLHGESSLS